MENRTRRRRSHKADILETKISIRIFFGMLLYSAGLIIYCAATN